MNGIYFQVARDETTDRFKELGYDVIDARESGYDIKRPTVIAIVESSPIEQSDSQKLHIDKNTVVTDVVNPKIIPSQIETDYYKITLIRPIGEDNKLFHCVDSHDGMEFCIEPAHPKDYKVIFTGYATLSTNSTSIYKSLNILTKAVFYQYPNIIGKKWIYFKNIHPNYVTNPHSPKPISP